MSTEKAPRWSYGRIVAVTVVVLVVIAAGMGVAGSRQAPRVGAAQLDEAYAVENTGSQLVLAPNQPMQAGKLRVSTTPVTGATVRKHDGKVVVTFAQALHYDTDYDVTVGPVTGRYTGARGSLHYRFRTPSPTLFTLVRSGTLDDGKPDRIVQVEGSIERTVFRAGVILEYADAGTSLIASTYDRGVNRLVRIDDDGRVHPAYRLDVPAQKPIFGLRADPRTGLFGYITPPHGEETERLYVRDVADPYVGRTPVKATDGTPIEVLDWMLIPGTREAVVQDTSGRIFMTNPDKPDAKPTPLGTYGRISGFVPSTTVLTLPDNNSSGIRLLDPLHGISRTVPRQDLPAEDSGAYALQQLSLDESGRAVVVEWSPGDGEGSYRIAVIGHGKPRYLLASEPGKADNVSICLAPDGGHVAIVVQPSHGTDDGYPVQPSRGDVMTYFADTGGGAVHEAPGAQPQWCSSGPTSNAVSPDSQ
jgi:hypothetical protein